MQLFNNVCGVVVITVFANVTEIGIPSNVPTVPGLTLLTTRDVQFTSKLYRRKSESKITSRAKRQVVQM